MRESWHRRWMFLILQKHYVKDLHRFQFVQEIGNSTSIHVQFAERKEKASSSQSMKNGPTAKTSKETNILFRSLFKRTTSAQQTAHYFRTTAEKTVGKLMFLPTMVMKGTVLMSFCRFSYFGRRGGGHFRFRPPVRWIFHFTKLSRFDYFRIHRNPMHSSQSCIWNSTKWKLVW